jgi:hypothetical protein
MGSGQCQREKDSSTSKMPFGNTKRLFRYYKDAKFKTPLQPL